MSAAFIQKVQAAGGAGATLDVSITCVPGNCLAVFVTTDLGTGSAVTVTDDTDGDAAPYDAGPSVNNPGDQILSGFYRLHTDGGTVRVRAHFSPASGGGSGIVVAELAGVAAYDGGGSAYQAAPGTGANAVTTGNVAPTVRDGLAIAAPCRLSPTGIPAVGAGWTSRGTCFALTHTPEPHGLLETRSYASLTPFPATWTAPSANPYLSAAMLFAAVRAPALLIGTPSLLG